MISNTGDVALRGRERGGAYRNAVFSHRLITEEIRGQDGNKRRWKLSSKTVIDICQNFGYGVQIPGGKKFASVIGDCDTSLKILNVYVLTLEGLHPA